MHCVDTCTRVYPWRGACTRPLAGAPRQHAPCGVWCHRESCCRSCFRCWPSAVADHFHLQEWCGATLRRLMRRAGGKWYSHHHDPDHHDPHHHDPHHHDPHNHDPHHHDPHHHDPHHHDPHQALATTLHSSPSGSRRHTAAPLAPTAPTAARVAARREHHPFPSLPTPPHPAPPYPHAPSPPSHRTPHHHPHTTTAPSPPSHHHRPTPNSPTLHRPPPHPRTMPRGAFATSTAPSLLRETLGARAFRMWGRHARASP